MFRIDATKCETTLRNIGIPPILLGRQRIPPTNLNVHLQSKQSKQNLRPVSSNPHGERLGFVWHGDQRPLTNYNIGLRGMQTNEVAVSQRSSAHIDHSSDIVLSTGSIL